MYVFIAFPILLLSTLLLNTVFNPKNRIAYILGMLIIGYANIVLIAEIASLLNLILPFFYLGVQIIFALIAWLAWRRSGKPSLLGPFAGGKWKIWKEFPTIQEKPALYILAVGVVLVYLLNAVIILVVPQNNYDSMTYHLSRVGYWMQHQSLSPWPTPNPRQTTSPINAELGLLWTTLLLGSDRLTGFVQWFSAVGIAIAICGIARLMGAKRSQGVFASLLWMTFPQIVLQSTTTQNDLVISFFFVSMLYFLFLGIRQEKVEGLILSGISFGLALGTKATFFIILPGFGITLLIIWAYTGRVGFKELLKWGIASLVGIGLLGLFSYVQNYAHYGDPFSIPEWTGYITNPGMGGSRLESGLTKLTLYVSNFLDCTGIPNGISETVIGWKTDFLKEILFESGIPFRINQIYSSAVLLGSSNVIHEDTSWFGLFSFLIFPATLYQFYQGFQKHDYIRLGLAVTGIGFWVTLSFLMGWTPYRVRYFVLAVSILAPLLAFLYQSAANRKIIFELIAIFASWILVSTVLQNATKPLVGPNAIWGLPREEIRLLTNPKMVPVLEMVKENVPANAVLATRLGVDHWDYVLFGDCFEKTIIQLDPNYLGIDEGLINESGADYVLLAPRERPFLEPPSIFIWVGEVDGWYLFEVSEVESINNPREINQKLIGQRDDKGLLEIDQALVGIVGLTELFSTDWGVEQYEGDGFMWLGENLNQGLRGFLWSEIEMPVELIFYLEPGPSREDTKRSFRVASYRYGSYGPIREGAFVKEFQIDRPMRYEMVVDLQKGLNEFRIFDLDRATIPILPNGDTRPLLARLNQIEVVPFENDPKIILLSASLVGGIRVSEQYPAEWGLEYANGRPFLWLGEGLDQGFRGFLWADREMLANIVLHLIPGPSREDSKREVEISYGRYGYYEDSNLLSMVIEFDGPIEYKMKVKLHKGLNQIELASLDEADIEILPNGDTRPLLIQLVGIDIQTLNE